MSNCMIDDDILFKSKNNILKCTNINKIDFSLNQFSMEGFSIVSDLCKNNHITEVNINENHIINLAALGDLIKKCK